MLSHRVPCKTPAPPCKTGARGAAMTAKPQPITPDEWLTPDEICTELKISRRTWDRLHAAGQGPRFRNIGRGIRVRRSWLEDWLEDTEASA